MIAFSPWFHHFHLRSVTYNFWSLVLYAVQTGTLIVTAILAFSYTKATNRQLRMAQAEAEAQRRERFRASLPFLSFQSSAEVGPMDIDPSEGWSIKVTNREGGSIYALEVFCYDPSVKGELTRRDFLGVGQSVQLVFKSVNSLKLPQTWGFDIGYFTRLNLPDAQHFRVDGRQIIALDHVELFEKHLIEQARKNATPKRNLSVRAYYRLRVWFFAASARLEQWFTPRSDEK